MRKIYMALAACAAACLLSAPAAQAGGILTNTNQHAAFLRNPARQAVIGIDGVYYNPAGVAFMPRGLHISANWQIVKQSRDVTAVSPLFAQAYGTDTKRFHGKVFAPVVPSVLAAYVAGRWSVSGSIAITGGGGKARFDEGLGLFNTMVMGAISTSTAGAVTPDMYDIATSFSGSSYIFGLQAGVSYKLTPNLSAFAGLRASYVLQGYDGHLRATMKGGGKELYNMRLDATQNGMGVAPLLGIDYRVGRWNMAVKYEFKTKVVLKNDTRVNTSPLEAYNDGLESRSDIPAMLSAGVSADATQALRFMAGFNYYFEKDAQMGGGKQQLLSKDTREWLAGVEVKPSEKLLLSTGVQVTRFGVTDEWLDDLGFVTNSVSVGIGAAWDFSAKMRLNAGYFHTFYADYTEPMAWGSNTYSRKNSIVSVGVDWRF